MANPNPNPSPATRFVKGVGGRGNRRGARDRLSAALLGYFCKDFEEHGEAVIALVQGKDPVLYLRIATLIVPKQLDISTEDDADLERMERAIEMLNAIIDARANASQNISPEVQVVNRHDDA